MILNRRTTKWIEANYKRHKFKNDFHLTRIFGTAVYWTKENISWSICN